MEVSFQAPSELLDCFSRSNCLPWHVSILNKFGGSTHSISSMFSALKGGIQRFAGHRPELTLADPAEEPFRNHILENISHTINTLIKKEWIAESTVEVLVNELRNADCQLRLPEYEALVGGSSGSEFEDRDNRRRPEQPSQSSISSRQSHSGTYPAPPIADRRPSASPKENRPPLPVRRSNSNLKMSTSPPPYSPNPGPLSSSPASAAAAAKASPVSASSNSGLTSPKGKRVVAIADYISEEKGDLQFRTGDIITGVTEVDANWYQGEFRGKKGIFPKNHVQ
ncbi:hypothetical protein BJ742DRAFT_802814 [Cladochytrium replicatum]|nr:hypothetical protein BJ742DRAFT_802814 [Cladochytrium replicatum]